LFPVQNIRNLSIDSLLQAAVQRRADDSFGQSFEWRQRLRQFCVHQAIRVKRLNASWLMIPKLFEN
jgi:hypothetical protein